jgi:hypothetical protein
MNDFEKPSFVKKPFPWELVLIILGLVVIAAGMLMR